MCVDWVDGFFRTVFAKTALFFVLFFVLESRIASISLHGQPCQNRSSAQHILERTMASLLFEADVPVHHSTCINIA